MRVWFLVLVATGCTATLDPGRHEGGVEGFCTAFSETICRAHVDCCTVSAPAACRDLVDTYCDGVRDIDEHPRFAWDSDGAVAVLEETAALAATCDREVFQPAQRFDRYFRGLIPEGDDCSAGTLGDLTYLACERGTWCRANTATGMLTCTSDPRPSAGQPCFTGICDDDTYCVPPDGTPSVDNPPRCVSKLVLTSPCTSNAECQSNFCNASRRCAPLTMNNQICFAGD
jgi:hypothetical protein